MSRNFSYAMVRGPVSEADETGCVTLTVEDLRCLSGKHEADGSRILELGPASLVRVCLHCRSLFVEKP